MSRVVCGRCNGQKDVMTLSGLYACDSCCGVGFFDDGKETIPKPEANIRETNLDWLKDVEKKLSDTEFYSPTMPLPWQDYHDIIRRLIIEVRKPGSFQGEGI
jgi:hypothetical protein